MGAESLPSQAAAEGLNWANSEGLQHLLPGKL